VTAAPAVPSAGLLACPRCGAERIAGATFCEACAFEFTDADTTATDPAASPPGEESPLDVGWTGPVDAGRVAPVDADADPDADPVPLCRDCHEGSYEDGYCDHCGAKEPDPRDHFAEAPASWVAGVCDIGRRHRRNEDAMALHADAAPLSFAALVVCDGVSNSTDSHIASLAAARAARAVLAEPLPRGVGTRAAVVAGAQRRLDDAVRAAQAAVVATTTAAGEAAVDSPPSCTFVAAVVADGVAVTGNVGDSRAYWLPDALEVPAQQLGEDDSFAAAQMSAGVPRKEAETSAGAHAITRWLGVDAPDDLTPHPGDLDLTEDGWLVVCSDGLWNYWSEAEDLRALVHAAVAELGPAGHHPPSLAQSLTDRANAAGGVDNITVALVRVGAVSTVSSGGAPPAEPEVTPHSSDGVDDPTPTHTDAPATSPDGAADVPLDVPPDVAPDPKDVP
jgi:serine/threonine protein phosphatase PrpC